MSQTAKRRSLSVPGFRSVRSNLAVVAPISLSFRSNPPFPLISAARTTTASDIRCNGGRADAWCMTAHTIAGPITAIMSCRILRQIGLDFDVETRIALPTVETTH